MAGTFRGETTGRFQEEPEEAANPRWPILVILAVALGLRIWGMGYGLPWSYSAEEDRVVKQAFALTTYNMKPADYGRPVFMSYIVAGEYGAYFGLEHLVRRVGPIHEFASQFLSRPSSFILIARATSIAFALAAIYVLYTIGKASFEWGVGVVAAAFLAVSPQHVKISHLGTGDSLAFLFMVLGLYFLVRLAAEKRLGIAFTAALMLGFAAAAEWQYAVLLVLAYAAYFMVAPREYKWSATLLGVFVLAVAFAFGMILPNGILLMKPPAFWHGFVATLGAGIDLSLFSHLSQAAAFTRSLVSANIYTLAVGWALLGAGVLGIVWGLAAARWKRTQYGVLLAALLAPYVCLMPMTRETVARWGLFMTPALALGAAYFVYHLLWRKHVPAVVAIVGMCILAAAVGCQGAVETGVLNLRRTADDTRARFASWALENVPHLSVVAATPGARFMFDARQLFPGIEWAQWREQVLTHWNGRAVALTTLPVPPISGKIPDVSQVDYVTIDGWSVEFLERAGSPQAAAILSFLDAARASGKVVLVRRRAAARTLRLRPGHRGHRDARA